MLLKQIIPNMPDVDGTHFQSLSIRCVAHPGLSEGPSVTKTPYQGVAVFVDALDRNSDPRRKSAKTDTLPALPGAAKAL